MFVSTGGRWIYSNYNALATSTDNSLLTIIAEVEYSLLVDGCGVVITASDPKVPSNIPGCPL